MTGAVEITTDSIRENQHRLASSLAASPSTMRRVLTQMIIEVEREAKRVTASGIFKHSGGNLKKSISHAVSGSDIAILTTGVKYGMIQEFGGQTRPHEIRAKASPFRTELSWRKGKIIGIRERGRTGGVLAFKIGGQLIFRKSVQHPGSRIPGVHYAQKSFEAKREMIRTLAAQIIREAAGAGK